MVMVYGFIEEARLLLHGGGAGQRADIAPTALSQQMAKCQPGLLVASMVALHENNKVQLEQVDQMFQVGVIESSETLLLSGSNISFSTYKLCLGCVCVCV